MLISTAWGGRGVLDGVVQQSLDDDPDRVRIAHHFGSNGFGIEPHLRRFALDSLPSSFDDSVHDGGEIH